MKYTPAQILALVKSGKKKFSAKRVKQAAKDQGKAGGLKGGSARAAVLTGKQMTSIARHAANVRWNIECDPDCPYCDA